MEHKRPRRSVKEIGDQKILKKINLDIVLLQESNRDNIDRAFIKSIQSSKDVGWAFVEANGQFGGLLTMWDEGKV